MQKEYSTSTILLSVVVSFSVGMSCNSKLIIADNDDIIIIDDTISDESDEDTTLTDSVLTKQSLYCYPQINEATRGDPRKRIQFTCGETKFLITDFSNEFSATYDQARKKAFYFPATKMLSEIGCKMNGKNLHCPEIEIRAYVYLDN